MCAPSPPAPSMPDIEGQTASNIETAKATNLLNNPNVIGPTGSTTFTSGDTFDQAGYDAATDAWNQRNNQINVLAGSGLPMAPELAAQLRGQLGSAPTKGKYTTLGRETMNQTLSPEEQAIYDQSSKNKLSLGQLAGQGAEAMKGLIGTQVDYSGAPAAPKDSEAIRKQVVDAMMSRNEPRLNQAAEQQDADLIAAGIRPGTEAWNRVKTEQGQTRNDALMQAQLAGGQESSRAYGMDEASRKNYIAELLSKRQVPLNEITALMSGSQVSNPFAGQGYQAGGAVQPTDINAGTNMLNQYNMNAYNQQIGQQNALIGGAATLGGAYIMGPRPKEGPRPK